MPMNITVQLRAALKQLEAERKRIDEQVQALQRVAALLDGGDTKGATAAAPAPSRKRRGMSAKARQAARERMQAYWAKRRAAKGPKAKAK
jgi:hypothetical protein